MTKSNTEIILDGEQLFILIRGSLALAQRVCHSRFCDPHPSGQTEVCKTTTEAITQLDVLKSQLDQVTKERDTAREVVTAITIEKQKAERVATSIRSACIEIAEKFRQRIQYETDEGMREAAFGDMVIEMESISLEEQKS